MNRTTCFSYLTTTQSSMIVLPFSGGVLIGHSCYVRQDTLPELFAPRSAHTTHWSTCRCSARREWHAMDAFIRWCKWECHRIIHDGFLGLDCFRLNHPAARRAASPRRRVAALVDELVEPILERSRTRRPPVRPWVAPLRLLRE